MTFDEYQKKARETAFYPQHLKVIYPVIGLAGETGEVCEKVKKVLRDKQGHFDAEAKDAIIKELGDTIWYLANICHDLEITLEEVASKNIEKLQARKDRNKLAGSGDDR